MNRRQRIVIGVAIALLALLWLLKTFAVRDLSTSAVWLAWIAIIVGALAGMLVVADWKRRPG